MTKPKARIPKNLVIGDEVTVAMAIFRRLESSPRACQESGAGTETCIDLQVDGEGRDPGSMQPERMCLDCRAVLRAHQLAVALTDIDEAEDDARAEEAAAAPENGPAENCAKCGTKLGDKAFGDEGKDGGVWWYCSEACRLAH